MKKFSLKEAYDVSLSSGLIPNYTIYNGALEKLLHTTYDGYKVLVNLNNLKLGFMPDNFSKFNPFTIENIKLYCKLNKIEDILISTEYNGAIDKLIWKCKNNHEYLMCWNDFKNGNRCRYCHIEKMKGEGNLGWKGGISNLVYYLRGQITQWKFDSLRQSKFKCIISNKPAQVIHHLYSFSRIVEKTMNILNMNIGAINSYTDEELSVITNKFIELHNQYPLGVCLTKKIHNLFHKLYGRKNNTPAQFEEFKQRYLSGEFNEQLM